MGAAAFVYALVVYPALNVVLGHGYPHMPTFGAPCPTTIATFGLLAWSRSRPPWWIWIVPVLWALVGTSAALALGIVEDLGLPITALLALAAQLRKQPEGAPGLGRGPS